jgi:hypothetical protein
MKTPLFNRFPWARRREGGAGHDLDWEMNLVQSIRERGVFPVSWGMTQPSFDHPRRPLTWEIEPKFGSEEDRARRKAHALKLKQAFEQNVAEFKEARLKAEQEHEVAWKERAALMNANLEEKRKAKLEAEREYARKLEERNAKRAEQDRLWREEEERIDKKRAEQDLLMQLHLELHANSERERNAEADAILKNKWQCKKCWGASVNCVRHGDQYRLTCYGCGMTATGQHQVMVTMLRRK